MEANVAKSKRFSSNRPDPMAARPKPTRPFRRSLNGNKTDKGVYTPPTRRAPCAQKPTPTAESNSAKTDVLGSKVPAQKPEKVVIPSKSTTDVLGSTIPTQKSEKVAIPSKPKFVAAPPPPKQWVSYAHIVSWDAGDCVPMPPPGEPLKAIPFPAAPKKATPTVRKDKPALVFKNQNKPQKFVPRTPWYKSRRQNPPSGFDLEKPGKNDRIYILFLAHWRATNFKGFAEEIHQKCANQQERYNTAFKRNLCAFTTRSGKNLYINIRTDATHCALDMRSLLDYVNKSDYLQGHRGPIFTNHLGRGHYNLTAEESHALMWQIASKTGRDVRVIPYKGFPSKIVRAPKPVGQPNNIVAVKETVYRAVEIEPCSFQWQDAIEVSQPVQRARYEPSIDEILNSIGIQEWRREALWVPKPIIPKIPRGRSARAKFFTKPKPEKKQKEPVFHPLAISTLPNRPFLPTPPPQVGKLVKGLRHTQANNELRDLAITIVDSLVKDKKLRTYRLITSVASALLSVTLAIRAKTTTDRGLAMGVAVINFFNVLVEIFQDNLKVKVEPEIVDLALKKLEEMLDTKKVGPTRTTTTPVDEPILYDEDSISRCSNSRYTQENLNAVIAAIPQEYADMPVLDQRVLEEKLELFERLKGENESLGPKNPLCDRNQHILTEYIGKISSMTNRKTILAPVCHTIPEESTSDFSSDIVIDHLAQSQEDLFKVTEEVVQYQTPVALPPDEVFSAVLHEESVVANCTITPLDISKYAAFNNQSIYQEICDYDQVIPPYKVESVKGRVKVLSTTTNKEYSKLDACYPYILSELKANKHPDIEALLDAYHAGYCVYCNNIVLHDPQGALDFYTWTHVEETQQGLMLPCMMGEDLGPHCVVEGPLLDFVYLNECAIFGGEILEDLPEEDEPDVEGSIVEGEREPQALLDNIIDTTDIVVSNIVAAIVGAITMAIACFLPGAAKIMADANTSMTFLNNLVSKGKKTQDTIAESISKCLFGSVSPEDKLKNDIISMIKELDECMSVPMDSLLDDVTFPHKFKDKIEQATELLKEIPKGEAVSTTLISAVKEARERYREINNALRDVNARPVPHVNMFMGLEGIGKTRASMHLSTEISNEKYQSQGIYTVACTTKYPMPLTGQKVWNIQEVANSKKPEEEFFLANFNSIVSNMHTNIEGAAVENKLMSPQPTVINCDTNVTPDELEQKIPLSKGGTAGCLSRLTLWNVKPTWSPEVQRLPRNSRPMKPDYSHLTFTRTVKKDNTWEEVDTQIGNSSYRALTLNQVKLYTYRQMELHYEQYLPLREQALSILAARERTYRAKLAQKTVQSNKRGTEIFSVLFLGKPEQGKTHLAQELIEMLGLKWPLGKSIHTIKSLADTTVDPLQHDKPQIYFFDDVFLGGLEPDNDRKFMELYNNMPPKSMVILTSNNVPVVHSRRPITSTYITRFGGVPTISYYVRYGQLFFEQGCYRRAGYHGRFMHYQNGAEIELDCNNKFAYIVENRQIKRCQDNLAVSRDDTLQEIAKEWANRVITEGVIPIRLLGYKIEKPEDADILLKFSTTKELFTTTSSLTNMLLAAATKYSQISIKPQILEKLAGAGTKPFVYHSPIKTHEDLVNYAQFFIAKVKTYVPHFTAYIEVGDTGTMYYDGTKINMFLTKFKPNDSSLFVASHQVGSTIMPNKIHIYGDPKPELLDSFNSFIRKPGPQSYIVETYSTEDVYQGLWSDTKDLVSAIKLNPAHHALLLEFTKTKTTAEYMKQKMIETIAKNETTWTNRILTLLTSHLEKIGLCIMGLAAIISAIYFLSRMFRSDFDKQGYALYLHHLMTNKPLPQSLAYFEDMTEEQLAPHREEALKLAEAYANRNNNDEYEDSAKTVTTVRKTILAPMPVKKNKWWTAPPTAWADEVEEYYSPDHWYKDTQMLKIPINYNEPGYVRELESVSTNLVKVFGKAGSCYGLGISNKLFIAPGHIGEIMEVLDDRAEGKSFKARLLLRPNNRDVAFYVIEDKTFPQFKDISHKFITSRAVPRLQNRLAIRTGVKAKAQTWSYVSGLLSFRAGNKPIEDYTLGPINILAQFGEVECAGGDHPTDQGDCGLPYCNEEQAKYGLPSIVGIHIGAYNNESKIIYAAVFREDIDYALAYLQENLPAPAKKEEKKPASCVLSGMEQTKTPKLYKVPNGNVYEDKQIPTEILPKDGKTRQALKKFCPKHDYHLELRLVEDRQKANYKLAPSVITSKTGYNTYVKDQQVVNFPQRKQEGSTFGEATKQIVKEFNSGLGVHAPLVEFETEVVEVLGTVDPHNIRSDVFNTYKRTKYANYLELDCGKRPIKNIDEFTPQEVQECAKTTLGKPNQIAHQAKLLDEVLPKLPTSLKRLATSEYEQRIICTHGKYLVFSDDFTILNGITPAIDPLHPNCGAYQPININKSCGYMCGKIHNRNKKADYLAMTPDGIRFWREDPKTKDFVATFQELKELLLAGKIEEAEQHCAIVFHTSKKDELLPLEKAWKGRVFENEDFMGLLLTRWVLGHFCAHSVAMEIEDYHCQIGIEPMMGFDRLAQKHLVKDYHFAGDISRHDKRCPKEFFDIIENALANAHKKMCKRCHKKDSCGWIPALRFVIKHIANSKRVILNMLVQVQRGMPSGSYVTGPINSEIIYLFYYICYVVATGNISMASFEEQVTIATCGDDNFISIDESIKDVFNLQTCQKIMKDLFGVQLDSDRKDGKLVPYNTSIDGLSFMSRFFRRMGNSTHYMGALKKESITAKLFYIRKTAESDIQYQTNFRMAIVEAAAWGREYYQKVIDNILYAISEIPSQDCCFATIYMNYDEIMRSYLGYCTGKKDLISYTILPKTAIQSAIMSSVSQINIRQQRGTLHVISNDFSLTPKGLWECTIRVQVHDQYGTYLISTRQGSSKAVAKELAAKDMLDHLDSIDQNVGKVVEGQRQPQMLPVPTPTTSSGGAHGIMQVLPQQPLTNPLTEQAGEMLPAQKVDDREASTATANGGILNQQVLPSDFSHNAITAFFSGVHPYSSTKITTKTPEGQLLLSVDIKTLLEANPALNALVGLHNYVQHDMVVKQRTVGPVGMTGEILISLVPSDALPYLKADGNAMAAIKRMYEYEVVGIQGNTARTTRLAKIVNSGFATARNSSNNQTSEVTLLVYLHTAISTTFAEPGDTSVINYYVEFTLGDQFDMSMPIAPLESIIATSPQSVSRPTRPQQRTGLVSMTYSTPTRFMVGGKSFGNLPTLNYLGNRTPLPYFFSQNGDNVTTGKPAGYNVGQWTSGTKVAVTTQPLWHSGDLPETPFDFKRLVKYQSKNAELTKEQFAALMLKMLVSEYGGEVYILEGVGSVPNYNKKYMITYLSTVPPLTMTTIDDTMIFEPVSLAVVTANGTTFVTISFVALKDSKTPFRYRVGKTLITGVSEPYLEVKTPKIPVVHTDGVMVEDIIFDTGRVNATIPYLLSLPDDVTKDSSLSPLGGYESGTTNGYYASSLPVVNVTNTDTRASNVMASGGPLPVLRNVASCGFSCSNMSYSGTKNTRGFIPTTEHWQLCAKLEDYMLQNNLSSVTGVLELDGIAVGEVNYDYDLGLTINTENTYVFSSPVTNVNVSSLRGSDSASLTPTVLSFPSYYTGSEGLLRKGKRIAQAAMAGAIAQAGAGLASGIAGGISSYISDKRTKEENAKDRDLKRELTRLVQEGQMTLAEAQARWEKERQERNIDAQEQLQTNSHQQQEHMAKLNQELDIERYQKNLAQNRANSGIINAASSTGIPSASWGNAGWDTPAVRKERKKHLRELPYDVSRPQRSATTIKGTNRVARSKIIKTLGSTYGESEA